MNSKNKFINISLILLFLITFAFSSPEVTKISGSESDNREGPTFESNPQNSQNENVNFPPPISKNNELPRSAPESNGISPYNQLPAIEPAFNPSPSGLSGYPDLPQLSNQGLPPYPPFPSYNPSEQQPNPGFGPLSSNPESSLSSFIGRYGPGGEALDLFGDKGVEYTIGKDPNYNIPPEQLNSPNFTISQSVDGMLDKVPVMGEILKTVGGVLMGLVKTLDLRDVMTNLWGVGKTLLGNTTMSYLGRLDVLGVGQMITNNSFVNKVFG